MTTLNDTRVESRPADTGEAQQQAIMEALSREPAAYDEDARRVLGSPVGYVEGKAMSQPEIVASIMTVGAPRDQ